MLVPFILPLKITTAILLLLIVTAIVVAPTIRIRRSTGFLGFSILALFCFPFLFTIVASVVDSYRYGVFQYSSVDAIKDRRVDLYLPPSARDLIIDKQGNGFRARYKITKEQVVQFLDAQWSEYGPYSVSKREESVDDSEGTRAMHDLWFGNLSWPYLKDATVYRGPTSARGTGFELWYSERNQIAYQRMGYW